MTLNLKESNSCVITMRLKFMKESQLKVIHYCHYWSYSAAWLKQQTSIDLQIRMSQRSQIIFQPMYTGCSSLTLNNSLHFSKIQISIMALTLYIPSRQSEFIENIDLLGPSVWIRLQQEIRQPLREDIQNDSFPEATKWYQCWKFTSAENVECQRHYWYLNFPEMQAVVEGQWWASSIHWLKNSLTPLGHPN